jgi:hypothetical protein
LNPESTPSAASQETALGPLLIFRYRWASTKIAAGDVLKFLGKLTYPEKYPFAAGFTNKFFIDERLIFRNTRNRFRIIKIRRQYIRKKIK